MKEQEGIIESSTRTARTVCGLLLCSVFHLTACSGADAVGEEDAVPVEEGTSETLESRLEGDDAEDIVFDLAESTTGWANQNSRAVDTTNRREGNASLTSTGSSSGGFYARNLTPVDARPMGYLTFWYYVSDASRIRRDRDAQIEISSHTAFDTEEMNWNLHALNLHDGWNFVVAKLPGNPRSKNGQDIDLSQVRRFRIYHFNSGSLTTKLDDLRFTNREPSLAEQSCAVASPRRTLDGSGFFESPVSYGAPGCSGGYVVDLNNYDARNDAGTAVAHGGLLPESEADCGRLLLRAEVFRKSGSSPTSIGHVEATGTWEQNRFGDGVCVPPYVVLDEQLEQYVPGQSYRLALQATALDDDGTMTLSPLALSTNRQLVPMTAGVLRSNEAEFWDHLPAESVDQRISKMFQLRETEGGQILCRAMNLEAAFRDLAYVPALERLGADAGTVEASNTAFRDAYELLCEVDFPGSSTVRQFQGELVQSWTLLDEALGSQIPSALGLTAYEAAFAADKELAGAFHNLLERCGGNLNEVLDFIYDGSLPSGVSGPNVLFKTCSQGNRSLRAELGLLGGSPLGGSGSPAAGFRQCMEEAVADLSYPCNDPRANSEGGGTPSGGNDDGDCDEGDDCDVIDMDEEGPAPSPPPPDTEVPEKVKDIEEKIIYTLNQIENYQMAIDQLNEVSGNIPLTPPVGQPAAWATWLYKSTYRVAVEYGEYKLEQERERLETLLCQRDPSIPSCGSQQCPAFDFQQGPAFYTTPSPLGGEEPLNSFDRINHCMCKYLGDRAGNCEDPEERQKQDCLTNPFGPDDGPRPECARYLRPAYVDTAAFDARFCQLIQPTCGHLFFGNIGSCGCFDDNPQAVADARDFCPRADVTRCPEDAIFDTRTCSCQDMNAGEVPFLEPGCRANLDGFPGGLDRYTLSSDRAAWLDLIDIDRDLDGTLERRNVIRFQPGYSAVATPGFYTQDFEQRGDRLYADVLLPEALPESGWQGLAQFHVTVGDIYNEFAGQSELTGQAPGSVVRAEAPLSSAVQDLMSETGQRAWITLVLTSSDDAPEPLGLTDLGFSGSPLPDLGAVSPLCERPEPTPVNPLPPFVPVDDFPRLPPGFEELFAGR